MVGVDFGKGAQMPITEELSKLLGALTFLILRGLRLCLSFPQTANELHPNGLSMRTTPLYQSLGVKGTDFLMGLGGSRTLQPGNPHR